MAKKPILDDEGNLIDPTKNLGAFLAKAGPPMLGEDVPAEPAWEGVVFETDDPDIKGKTGKEVVAVLAQRREREVQLQRQLQEEQQQRRIEQTVRNLMPAPAVPKPEPPKDDPRWAQVNDLLFTEPDKAEKLRREIFEDAVQVRVNAGLDAVKHDIRKEFSENERQAQGRRSFDEATRQLIARGVPMETLRAKARHVLVEVTTPGTSYFANGGPLNPDNLVAAYGELFGFPTSTVATPAVVPTPPGSARPATAAVPQPKAGTDRVNPTLQKQYEYVGERIGIDPAKLMEMRAKRTQDGH